MKNKSGLEFSILDWWVSIKPIEDYLFMRRMGDVGINFLGYNFLIMKIW